MLKKTPVVMLPTNQKAKKGDYYIGSFGKIAECDNGTLKYADGNVLNLYFLSDEEIKEGDWYYELHTTVDNPKYLEQIHQAGKDNDNWKRSTGYRMKIIATTDESLSEQIMYYPDGGIIGNKESYKSLPQPSQSFIERFIERYNAGAPITHVMVEYVMGGKFETFKEMKEFKPHLLVNPKDNTITIKPVKDNWTREEVIELLKKNLEYTNISILGSEFDKWIEQNL